MDVKVSKDKYISRWVDLENLTGLDLSFSSTVMKSYPFATLSCINKEENMQPNKFS